MDSGLNQINSLKGLLSDQYSVSEMYFVSFSAGLEQPWTRNFYLIYLFKTPSLTNVERSLASPPPEPITHNSNNNTSFSLLA